MSSSPKGRKAAPDTHKTHGKSKMHGPPNPRRAGGLKRPIGTPPMMGGSMASPLAGGGGGLPATPGGMGFGGMGAGMIQ